MMRITEAVKQLIIINVIFFVGAWVVGDAAYNLLALYFPENPNFKVWQVVTHMFMHSRENIMHIFFNMFALFSFGVLLEQMWGPKKFLFFYFSCGVGAALLHIGVNYITFNQGLDLLVSNGFNKSEILQTLAEGKYNTQWEEFLSGSKLAGFIQSYITPAVGASGAIYGILVAFAFMVPNAELMLLFLPIPIKAKYFVPGLLAIDLFLGLRGQSIFGGAGSDGVAHFAHLGGALVGFIMMWYWKNNQFNNNRWN